MGEFCRVLSGLADGHWVFYYKCYIILALIADNNASNKGFFSKPGFLHFKSIYQISCHEYLVLQYTCNQNDYKRTRPASNLAHRITRPNSDPAHRRTQPIANTMNNILADQVNSISVDALSLGVASIIRNDINKMCVNKWDEIICVEQFCFKSLASRCTINHLGVRIWGKWQIYMNIQELCIHIWKHP